MRKWIALGLIAILILVGCSQTDGTTIKTATITSIKTATITSVSLKRVDSIQVVDNSLKATDDYMVYYYDEHNFVVGPSFTSSQTPVLLWVLDNKKSKHVDIKKLLTTSGGSFTGVVWVLDSKLYVFVLTDMVGQGMKGDVYTYEDGQWNKVYTIETPADIYKAVVHDGKVYLYGGRAGLLQITDDGKVEDIGNLDHVSAVGFWEGRVYILAGINPPTVYEYAGSKEPRAKRIFKATGTTTWVGMCDFHDTGIQPLFVVMKYEGIGDLPEKYLYVYDVAYDKLISAGKVDDEFYKCFVYNGNLYIQGESGLYRLNIK